MMPLAQIAAALAHHDGRVSTGHVDELRARAPLVIERPDQPRAGFLGAGDEPFEPAGANMQVVVGEGDIARADVLQADVARLIGRQVPPASHDAEAVLARTLIDAVADPPRRAA